MTANPELRERPFEIAYYRRLQKKRDEGSKFGILLVGMWIGFLSGVFWKVFFEWIF